MSAARAQSTTVHQLTLGVRAPRSQVPQTEILPWNVTLRSVAAVAVSGPTAVHVMICEHESLLPHVKSRHIPSLQRTVLAELVEFLPKVETPLHCMPLRVEPRHVLIQREIQNVADLVQHARRSLTELPDATVPDGQQGSQVSGEYAVALVVWLRK